MHRTDACFRNHVTNMIKEMNTKGITTLYENTSTKSVTKQKQTIMLDYIQQLVSLLDMKNSFDTSKVITEGDIATFARYYSQLVPEKKAQIHELFGIRTTSKDIEKVTKTVLGQMLHKWNGMKLCGEQISNAHRKASTFKVQYKDLLPYVFAQIIVDNRE